ncbi:hypothetical protein IH824_18395, partial [candidate division KSB1 bacterium]|nr:hypothetical protein [candidate division KSB1 bacterium]
LLPISQGKNNKGIEKEPHKGDHIKIALGHPNLESLAKQTSLKMIKAKEDELVEIPDYLFELIVNKNELLKWNFKKEDESSTE